MTEASLTAEDAAARDASDPLRAFRDRFIVGAEPPVYFDGNSLGRPPRATARRWSQLIEEEWAQGLIGSWEHWQRLPEEVGERLGAAVLGADAGQTVVADSTTVNLYKAVHAATVLAGATAAKRNEIVVSEADFPTDRYMVEAVAAARGLTVRRIPAPEPGCGGPEGLTVAALAPLLGPRTAVVVASHVDYRTGFLADMAAVTDAVHSAGAVVVWDLCHSAGVVPTALDADGVDLAVGCTYKYLNAGPGAPAFLYAARRHHDHLESPIPGWWSAAEPFAMAATYRPAADIRRMLSGTPNVPGLVAVDEGVKLVAEAGVEAVRAKSVRLTALAMELVDAWLAPAGWEPITSRDPERRGGHVAVQGPGAEEVTRRLAQGGMVADFRRPDVVRLGLSPLTTGYEELWRGLRLFADLL